MSEGRTLRRAFAVLRRDGAGAFAYKLASELGFRRVLLLAVMMPLLGFFFVGVTESVWENGIKINQLFWFWCGISISTSTRMLAERRAAVRSLPQPGELEGSPAFGR